MQTTIQHQAISRPDTKTAHPSLWSRFIQWADSQEKHRFGWTAGIIAGHGCVATIITAAVIIFTGNQFIFWPITIGVMAACLIVNLAAMPTKIIIPVFFASLLIDLLIIAICLSNGFDVSGTYI